MLFFQLINARHVRASTVLTSNKGFEEWGHVLGDEVMAAAAGAACSARTGGQYTVVAVGQYWTSRWHISASSSRSW